MVQHLQVFWSWDIVWGHQWQQCWLLSFLEKVWQLIWNDTRWIRSPKLIFLLSLDRDMTEGCYPGGPFTKIPSLARMYTLGGILPLLWPMNAFPYVMEPIISSINKTHKMKSRIIVGFWCWTHADLTHHGPHSIKVPILMIHCHQDLIILSTHSAELFDTLLDPLLGMWCGSWTEFTSMTAIWERSRWT